MMNTITMKKAGIAAIVVIIAVISSLVLQFQVNGFGMAALDMQKLTVDTLRLVVIVWLACWAGKETKKADNK